MYSLQKNKISSSFMPHPPSFYLMYFLIVGLSYKYAFNAQMLSSHCLYYALTNILPKLSHVDNQGMLSAASGQASEFSNSIFGDHLPITKCPLSPSGHSFQTNMSLSLSDSIFWFILIYSSPFSSVLTCYTLTNNFTCIWIN